MQIIQSTPAMPASELHNFQCSPVHLQKHQPHKIHQLQSTIVNVTSKINQFNQPRNPFSQESNIEVCVDDKFRAFNKCIKRQEEMMKNN